MLKGGCAVAYIVNNGCVPGTPHAHHNATKLAVERWEGREGYRAEAREGQGAEAWDVEVEAQLREDGGGVGAARGRGGLLGGCRAHWGVGGDVARSEDALCDGGACLGRGALGATTSCMGLVHGGGGGWG